ncbi:hypothetical protein KCU85_g4179, partial [Aureobasidium melanogenum]
MALASPEVKLSDLLRCDQDGCNKWWRRLDLKTSGSNNFRRCPHCREANITPTKYWIGGLSGPREPAYPYPARTPQMYPLPLKTPTDRPSSTKRQLPGDSPSPSPTQNKKPRNNQHQQQSSPMKSLCVAEVARMERKDSLQSTPATPTASKTEASLDEEVLNTLAAWKACKGCPDVHLQKELKDAEENLRKVRESIPKIERKVKETQKELDAAGEFLKKCEVLVEDIDKAIGKAGGLDVGQHKVVKQDWCFRPRKHAQLAYEENNRCSKSWQNAVQDRADATRLENQVKERIERIHEERKQLKKFGEYVSVLPSSSGV